MRVIIEAILGMPGLVILAAITFWLVMATIPRVEAAGCHGQLVRASWYGKETCGHRLPGRGKGKCQTASGIPFDGSQWLVAHKTLPFHSKLRLSYGGKSVVVPVEDRGPWVSGRTLDLSRAVAVSLGTIKAKEGAPLVCMERL